MTTTTPTSGAADLPEALTADQWLDLAIRHANKDWNSAQPDGYANAVKALCADFAALTAQAPSQPGFDAGDMASAAAQGFRDGWTAAQAISAEPAGATEMENLQRTAVGWQERALRAERNWAACRRWAIAGGAPIEKLGDDPDQPFHAASPAIEGESNV